MKMPKINRPRRNWGNTFPECEIRRREYGFKQNLGWESKFKFSLYSTLSPTLHSEQRTRSSPKEYLQHGGIFNFGFSPDGRQLAAACENKCILFYDPITHKQTHHILDAHNGCVNCVRFLDGRLFATCSDDNTVALWDVRRLNKKIRLLRGHDNWVKNIEYSSNDGLLVTSGFDGKILGWDINSFSQEGPDYSELFRMKGLMRVRLTPDVGKLVICTTSGHMMLIHNLNLKNLFQDWKEFQNQIYGVGSTKSILYPASNKRNRFEFISDFPAGNNAEVIHSLQVHPQGWCVLSRNTSTENTSEWTCVHDIQDMAPSKEDLQEGSATDCPQPPLPPPEDALTPSPLPDTTESSSTALAGDRRRRPRLPSSLSRIEIPRVEIMLSHYHRGEGRGGSDSSDNSDAEDDHLRSRGSRESMPDGLGGDFEGFEGTDGSFQLRVTSLGILEALERIIVLRRQEERRHRIRSNLEHSEQQTASGDHARPDFSVRYRRRESNTRGSLQVPNSFYIQDRASRLITPISLYLPQTQNLRSFLDEKFGLTKPHSRLTNYTQELNKGRGFIKELCFSADGRLICSPYGRGVRLLMFDNKCSELSHCVKKRPQPLYAVASNMCHSKCVVSTQFSPTDCLLVSGCLSGEIVWHQPNL